MGETNVILGKKTFFVHPSVFVQNEIVADLIQQEHEIYIAKDEEKLKKVLKKYPDSLVFASIDETLSAEKWETWIRAVMGGDDTKNVSMGILSNTNNEDARRLYLNTLRVSCGFVPVKTERTKVVKTLADILNAAEAKGRRKYIRADTRGETLTTINLPVNGIFVTGEIQDISVVGLSCAFSQEIELEKNALVSDMQIKLQSALLKAEGIVFGSRTSEEGKVYVILFTQKLDPSVRAKIRTYIQKNLQAKMNDELK